MIFDASQDTDDLLERWTGSSAACPAATGASSRAVRISKVVPRPDISL